MFTKDQITEHGFSDAQVEAINTTYGVKENELKGLGNTNADAILNDVAKIQFEKTGVVRKDKEKASIYLNRSNDEYTATQIETKSKDAVSVAEAKTLEWETKFKTHKGDETLKTELATANTKIGEFPQLLQDKEDVWTEKYNTLEADHKGFQLKQGIAASIPKLDPTINEFEAKAKIAAATLKIESDYELSYDDKGNLIGEKDYNKSLVSELFRNDEGLKPLLFKDENSEKSGGAAAGAGSNGKLTFPDGISRAAKEQMVRAYITTTLKLDVTTKEYTKAFNELMKETA